MLNLKNSTPPSLTKPSGLILHDKNPPQMSCDIWKNVSKNCLVPLMSSSISVSIPKHMNVRMRSSSSGHTLCHTRSATPSALMRAPPPPPPVASSSARVSMSDLTESKVLDTMNPVLGWTMPAVPPTPSVRCGRVGRTPPMGMRQYSSSCTDLTLMPIAARRCCSFTLRSSNSSPGRSTKLVSSKKIFVSVNGMAYRNVGCMLFISLYRGDRCSSRQSMNSIVSRSSPCGSSVSHMIPNAA